MAQELQEMGFSGFGSNPNYGALDTNEKQADFNDIKINLGQNQPEYEYKKTEPSDQEEQRMSVSSNNSNESGNQQQQLTQAQIDQRANRCCNGLHPDYYQQYFDVTTQDVLQRITFSLVPMNNKLEQVIGENPDFYGPFWIYTTLIFLLAFAENLHNYIAVGYEEFEYDFKNFPPSFTIVYGIGFGAPLILCTIMKYLSDIEMKYKAVT